MGIIGALVIAVAVGAALFLVLRTRRPGAAARASPARAGRGPARDTLQRLTQQLERRTAGRLSLGGLPEAEDHVRELFADALSHGERDEWDAAVRLLEEALRGARDEQAVALHGFAGMSCYLDGSLGRALEHFEDAGRMATELHDELCQADSLLNSGIIFRERSEPAKALKVFESALDIYRHLGLRRAEADALFHLGFLRQLMDESAEARKKYEAALSVYRSVGHDWGVGNALTRLGDLHAARSEFTGAVQKYHDALQAFAEAGAEAAPGSLMAAMRTVYQRLGHRGFVAACQSAGWSEEDATALIEGLDVGAGN